jgi:hypothetical protein
MLELSPNANKQFVKFDDLLNKYNYVNRFDAPTASKIENAFKEAIPKLIIKDFPKLDASYNAFWNPYFETIPRQIEKIDNKWNFTSISTGRNKLGTHKDVEGLVFKFFEQRPPQAHPMATSLRAPMADVMQTVVEEFSLDQIEVPKKGIVPLFSDEIISKLDEHWVNHALVTAAEKKEFFSKQEMMTRIFALQTDNKKKLANQICTLIENTGAQDITWLNLEMNLSGKILILDAEPLFGELNVDCTGKEIGFTKTIDMEKFGSLKKSARIGLSIFLESSEEYSQNTFADTAARRLDKFD